MWGEGTTDGEAGSVGAGVADKLMQPGLLRLDTGGQPYGGRTTPVANWWRWARILWLAVHEG